MELTYYILLILILVAVNGQDPAQDAIPPTVHQVLLLDPIPIANLPSRDILRLECSASGNPAPKIEWSFNGKKFDESGGDEDDPLNRRHTIKGNRLTIRDIKGKSRGDPNYYDSGRYRCIASNSVGSVFLEKNIQIRVMGQFLPGSRMKDNAKNWNPTIGRQYQIECPQHTFGYGTQYRWGIVPILSNQPEYWLPGQVNRKLFYKLDGTLVWSVISRDDIKESRDAGGLRCILINFGQFAASNQQQLWQPYAERVEFRKPIIVARLAPTMNAPINTEYRLVCGATGNPVPTYHWQYQGQDVVSRYNNSEELNFEFFQFYGHKMELRIRRVTKYSGGTFKCFARNKLGQTWSIGQLSVSFPPKWMNKFPELIEVPLTNRFELVCNATGFPQPKFEWFQNSTLITNDGQDRKIVSGDKKGDVGGLLIIRSATYADNGIYICVASNYLDTLTMSVNIKIEAMAPVFKIPIDNPIYLFRTETMYIKCDPAGGPIPEKKWFVNDTAVEDGGSLGSRFKVHKNGTLQISNVKKTDNGRYKCEATNSLGKATSDGNAYVLEPTVITRPPESLSHLVGWGYTVMYCGASWDPRLDLRIEWYKGGVRMAKFSDMVYLEDRAKGPPRLLYIKNLTIYDAGNYSCHAYTKVGNIMSDQWAHALLRIKGAPLPPAGVAIRSGFGCEDYVARLEWSRGEELMEETRYFFIEFSTNTSSQAGKWFGGQGDPLIPNSAIIAEPGTRVNADIPNLVPGANLIFRIRAKSQFAVGNASRPSLSGTCITPPAAPRLNPLNVTGVTSGPGTLKIVWRMIMDVYHGAPGFHYLVKYKQADAAAFTPAPPIKDANVTEFEIPTPGIYTKYIFNVRSANNEGEGPLPKDVEAYSGREPPTDYPRRFRVKLISRFTVSLRWSPVADAEGYRVTYYNVTDAEHFRGRSRRGINDPIVKKYAYFMGHEFSDGGPLSNLTAQVEFIATVAAVNNGGVGPESYQISFTTEARVPGIPSNVKLVVYGSDIHLSWHPPINPNGYIEQYVISWYESDKERRKKKLINQKKSFDRRSREAYLIGIFTPFVYYDIKLMARNRVGPGNDWQRERVVVSAPDIPGKGGAPKAVPFDDTKINVTYQRPSYGGLPNTIYVFYRPKGHYYKPPQNMSDKFPHRAWILITELEFLVYDFWTVGVNTEGQSETSDVTEMQPVRRPKGKQAHASPFEWWRSNWFIAISMCCLFVLITAIVVILLLREGPVPYARMKDKEEKTNGYPVAGFNPVAVPVVAVEMGGATKVDVEATRDKEMEEKKYLSTSDEPQSELDNPPPRYSSQSSLEKKEGSVSETASHSGTGSQYSETGSESESASASGSEYSDEDASEYSDEEKKRESSGSGEEDEDYEDDDLAAFV